MTLPDEITLDPHAPFTADELRAATVVAGGEWLELDDADRLQMLVWIELRRRGCEPSWLDAGRVRIRLVEGA